MNQWELVMRWYIYALPVNGVNPVDAHVGFLRFSIKLTNCFVSHSFDPA